MSERTEVAIVGMAGRFPGAGSVDALWEQVSSGRTGVRRMADDELRASGVDPALPGLVPYGGVLRDIDLFDANFFGFARREAELCDPQHRLMLEICWQAFEDAGHVPEAIGGPAGVYLGSALNTYGMRQLLAEPTVATSTFQHLMGMDKDFLATRVAYKLGLTGPALSVQTACSTSLVAVAMACQHLLDFSVDFALAGGATVAVPHHTGYIYQESGIFASDGACRAFDAGSDGTVPGSGVAAVLLRRLDDALSDGDHIYAIIRGSAINNDGAAKAGYTAPSVGGQARCIAAALSDAEVDPDTIGLMEAHGTGTQLGDPIELAALRQVFREQTQAEGFCAMGSVKTNVGHLNAASGVTGLIKAALALHHKQLPPSLHFTAPNPRLELDRSPFYVNTQLRPWPAPSGHPRRAGVSSFGFGGTNAHAVLEEAPPRESPEDDGSPALVVVSAHTRAALDETSSALATHLDRCAGPLQAVAETLQSGRRAMRHRRVLVADSTAKAAQKLRSGRGIHDGRAPDRAPPVLFLFPGQGSQYPTMAAELYLTEPSFLAHLDRFSAAVERHGGPQLGALLTEAPDLTDTALVQPLMVGIGIALVGLLAERGVQPAAVGGHSLGELTAAIVAGVLSEDDGARLAVARGQAMGQSAPGGMMAVWARPEELESLRGECVLAAHNDEELCALAGSDAALVAAAGRLEAAGIRSRRLPGRCAFHSPLMTSAAQRLRVVGASLRHSAPQIPLLCNVSGSWHPQDRPLARDYWAEHACQPVRFADNLDLLLADPDAVVVELGPGSSLCSLVRRHPRGASRLALPTLPGPRDAAGDHSTFLTALGRLWVAGANIGWSRPTARQRLPGVALQRRRFWLEDPRPVRPAAAPLGLNALVDLL